MITFVATCLTAKQAHVCADFGITVVQRYARSIGEVTPGCVTDFSLHCFNSDTLALLQDLGVARATLHPELNTAQIRDIIKPIPTEAVIYGRLPLMQLGVALHKGTDILTDRTGANFPVHGHTVYNAVPLYVADKLAPIEKTGLTHGRLAFTIETADETRAVIKAYLNRQKSKSAFTRGKWR
ncbi:MAG: hypothetical protein FWC71_10595 [Defluviitaleaceae bacterium]|nr:hypothetical protein [Defluviitaleaceae bacterium]